MIRNAIAAGAVLCGLAACSQGPDLSAIQAERTRPIQRYDITESLAANGRVLVAATQAGAMLVSKDEGKTWARQTLGTVSMVGLATCPDGSFVGIDFNHKVWSGDASGAHWKSVPLEKPRTPLAVTCDGRGQWWVAGSGVKIAHSADRGATWQVTDLGEDAQLTTLQFIDDRFGVALGEFGLVVATQDGGATWQKGAKIPGDFYPYAALFLNRREGYASGIAGQMLHTQDGGATWTKLKNLSGASLYRLFLHDGRPYGVGTGGIVARLDGDAFRAMPYPDAQPAFLAAGASIPAQPAIAVGGPGGLIRVLGTTAN